MPNLVARTAAAAVEAERQLAAAADAPLAGEAPVATGLALLPAAGLAQKQMRAEHQALPHMSALPAVQQAARWQALPAAAHRRLPELARNVAAQPVPVLLLRLASAMHGPQLVQPPARHGDEPGLQRSAAWAAGIPAWQQLLKALAAAQRWQVLFPAQPLYLPCLPRRPWPASAVQPRPAG